MKTKLLLLISFFIIESTYAQLSTEIPLLPLSGVEYLSVDAADLDGDLDLDLISTPYRSSSVRWFENKDGLGSIAVGQKAGSTTTYVQDAVAADIDNDGDMDIFSSSPGKIVWIENTDGNANFSPDRLISSADGASDIMAIDMDGDGDMDLLTNSYSDYKTIWYENTDGKGSFVQHIIVTNSFPNTTSQSVYALDIDGDGDMDVLESYNTNDANKIVWYKNLDGLGSFGSQQIIQNGDRTPTVFAGDVDGDGDMDVVSASEYSSFGFEAKLSWYENTDGLGNFGSQQIITALDNIDGPRNIKLADIDLDGDKDMFLATYDKVIWYENMDGLGGFGPELILANNEGHSYSEVIIKDLNGDGSPDVIASNFWGLSWWENLMNLQPTDDDGDGFNADVDCNDQDDSIYPGAPEIPGDGIDQDCDGEDTLIWYQDNDGDTFGNPDVSMEAVTQPQGYVADNTDCDDTNAAIHEETTWYMDFDGDNYAVSSMISCSSPGEGYTTTELPITDCNDTDESIYPGAPEIPGDGIDQDCDGEDTLIWYQDSDGDTFGNPDVSMESVTQPPGYVADNTDCDDTNAAIHEETTWYLDFDGDNYAVSSMISCSSPGEGYTTTELLITDCNDTDESIYPGAPEIPGDGIDQDCDGEDTLTWYQDNDGDTFGNPDVSMESVTQPPGYVADNTDCDDTNAAIHEETTWYMDFDGDNYAVSSMISCSSPGEGYTTTELPITDCNDTDESIYPGAPEIPGDGIDQDCDGEDNSDGGENCANDIFGDLNLNPARSSNNIFIMETPDGIINMNSLASRGSNYTYSGTASSIKIKVKAQGRTLTINGSKIALKPNIRYEFTGLLTVSLLNRKAMSKKNQSNGHWWIRLEGNTICITEEIHRETDNESEPNFVSNKQPLIYNNNVHIYPNKFSDYCNISYRLNKKANVGLRIYDLNNRLIKVLKVINSNKGDHNIQWDGTNSSGRFVRNGIYVLQFETQGSFRTYKIIFKRE